MVVRSSTYDTPRPWRHPMTRHPLLAAIALTLAASVPAARAADGLTIYSGGFEAVAQSAGQPGGPGFALVERRVGFELKPGDNQVSLDGLPQALDASSVVLKPLSGRADPRPALRFRAGRTGRTAAPRARPGRAGRAIRGQPAPDPHRNADLRRRRPDPSPRRWPHQGAVRLLQLRNARACPAAWSISRR